MKFGSKITDEKCYVCGYPIGNRNITFRHDRWYHIKCAERLEQYNLKALALAEKVGFIPMRFVTAINGEIIPDLTFGGDY